MFKRHTVAESNAAMREYWLQTKAKGRRRFIWREVLESIVFGLILVPAIELFVVHPHSSGRSIVFVEVIMLPIFLLGGYLTGRWKWSDLEKKYAQGSLPPWD